jgi:hypothetical protein
MRQPEEPLSLAAILRELDELLFVVQKLDSIAIGDDQSVRDELGVKIVEARGLLAEIIIQRTD